MKQFSLSLVLMGAGVVESIHPPIEDIGISTYFTNLSVMGRYTPPPIKTKLKYVKNAHILKATT